MDRNKQHSERTLIPVEDLEQGAAYLALRDGKEVSVLWDGSRFLGMKREAYGKNMCLYTTWARFEYHFDDGGLIEPFRRLT